MSLLTQKTHRIIYIFALSLLAVSLPFSLFMLSVAQFMLIINWFLEGNIIKKIKNFFTNKASLAFSLIFFLHILGLFYTSDFNYAFKDIRIKLPLLLLPLVVSTSLPLSLKEIKMVLFLFIAAIITSTFISTAYYYSNIINNIRDISRFISHIRFSLMICLSIILILYFAFSQKNQKKILIAAYFITVFWLIFFLLILESVTGLSILTVLFVIFVIKFIFSKAKVIYKIIYTCILIILFTSTFFYVKSVVNEYFYKKLVDFSKLETYTKQGNPYLHDSISLQTENAHLIWIYISEKELAKEWAKRSDYNFYGTDDKNQYLKFTLIRFLTSKGLRKDAEGMKQLSNIEIEAIEKGIPSISFLEKMTLKKRIYEILWEYENYAKDGNANGLSVMLRFEFAKAALGIIRDNFLFGVGTGDVNMAFDEQYDKTNSLLKTEYRWRSHNQYFSFFVAFGLIGFICFIISLLYPPIKTNAFRYYPYIGFFVIAIVSMFTEDTLETQIGVTFFAFFSALFLFGAAQKNNVN